jgi:hypothetical protein
MQRCFWAMPTGKHLLLVTLSQFCSEVYVKELESLKGFKQLFRTWLIVEAILKALPPTACTECMHMQMGCLHVFMAFALRTSPISMSALLCKSEYSGT